MEGKLPKKVKMVPKKPSARVPKGSPENESVEMISETSEEPITRPFDPSKIDITLKPMSLDLLIKRMKENEIDLNTKFQRKMGLWSAEQQSRLIESLMVRIPLPAFYFDGSDDNNWLVVDGLQRLTSIKRFVIDKEFKLQNLEFLTQFHDFSFDDLPRHMQRRIEETQVTAFIINPGTPTDVKFNIFKRINTGGLVLTAQEIRHALNQGTAADYVEALANEESFLQATCNAIRQERMEDRDFVMRFIAFTLESYKEYSPDLDTFLNRAMARLNKLPQSELEEMKERFKRSMKAAYAIFGEDAFRKRYKPDDGRNPINKALFETWAVHLGKLSPQEIKQLVKQKERVKELFMEAMGESEFERSISQGTNDVKKVKTRFERIEKIINEVLAPC